MSKPLPDAAQVVIVGGGIIGCSIAYHLTKLGLKDVVLLERKQLTCGTTWHAAGLLTTLRSTENATKLALYSQQLYRDLENETGQGTGFSTVGSIQLATTPERLEEMRRGCAMAKICGVESHEISPKAVSELWPLANVDDVIAGFYFPNDARTNPVDTTQALAKGAKLNGAKIFENIKVSDILQQDGHVTGVTVGEKKIRAEFVVNATGMWARDMGLRLGVNIPLQAAEHYYLITENIKGLHSKLPILRDPGMSAYYREESGKLMLGLFEPIAAPWGKDGIPKHFCFDDLPPDWERLTPYLEKAMKRVPVMENAGIQLLFNGPESFTPDHNYLMGEAPNIKGLFVAAGFNSLGILSGGGAGKVIAHWIVNGYPPMDVFETDLTRVLPFQNNQQYLIDRTVESLGIGYQYHWPFRQWETARNVKKSPLHDRMLKQGACFGESAGWERPNWFAKNGQNAYYEYSYGRQNWFELNAEEHRSVRENVGLFEQSSFSKIFVDGPDAATVLNKISTNNIDVEIGKIVYTQWLNSRGTIEADLTITRVTKHKFMVVTAAFTHTHVYSWLKNNTPKSAQVYIVDQTSSMVMLNIQGPNSRELLSGLTSSALSNDAFPFATSQYIEIGYAKVLAVRVTYMGELGWELYIPVEFSQQVYDAIVEQGKLIGLRHCGYHTLNSLRIEKAYREFGHDIGSDDSPFEAGLIFASDFKKKNGFIGKEALLKQKENKIPSKRLVQFLLEDPKPLLYHNEPIYLGNRLVGHTTSGMYGHTLGGAVALGYVRHFEGVSKNFVEQSHFEIEIASKRYSAKASIRPMYDPSNIRVLS